MAITITYASSISGGGVSIQTPPIVRSGSLSIGLEETLVAAQAGTLTTRTSDIVGTITMTDADHTIATADVVDIYWDGGVQYAVTVGTVSTTSVPFTAGSGDVLPTSSTAVTIVPVTDSNISIDGDNVGIIAIVYTTADTSLRTAAHVQLNDSGNAEIAEIDLVANVPQVWDITGGATNIFTGNPITYIAPSQASSTVGGTLKIVGVADASP